MLHDVYFCGLSYRYSSGRLVLVGSMLIMVCIWDISEYYYGRQVPLSVIFISKGIILIRTLICSRLSIG